MVLLQESNMEYIMNFGALRELQTICNFTNPLLYMKGTRELRPKLAAVLHIRGCDRPVQQAQPNPLPDLK
jgi:hypothetical protein